MPINEYYDNTGAPTENSPGASNVIESEFYAIEAGFMKLPPLLGNANKLVVVNALGTKMTTATAASVLLTGGVELQINKDDYDGYVGLDAYDIKTTNVAGTVVSFITNTNAAPRTYTLPDVTGTVALFTDITATNVGLGNCDNTSDLNKPISTATQTALNLKVDKTTTVNGHALSANVTVTASDVGLGNCDNTSDLNKPVSTATQTALNLKANLASPTFTGTPAAPTAAAGTNTTQLATCAFVQGEGGPGYKSRIIDGDFNIWEEATTQTTSGYGSDTMWFNGHSGTTKTHTRQAFTLGQTDVPGNPAYYSRTVVTTAAGAGNYCKKTFRIEDVSIFSGENVTVSFYAKADAAKNIAISFTQNFGTGGAPSADVTGIGAQKLALTTSWVLQTATIAIPSVTGKTLGTTINNYLEFIVWFDAGTTYDAQTDTLGQQSGTFEISRVRLVGGSKSGNDIEEILSEQRALSFRYYYSSKGAPSGSGSHLFKDGYNTTGSILTVQVVLPVTMRVAPVGTKVGTWSVSNCAQPSIYDLSTRVVGIRSAVTTTGRAYFYGDGTTQYFTLDARL